MTEYGEIMSIQDQINQFLDCREFAVAGASTNREKYGNKVLRCYAQNGRTVYPINPRAAEIEGFKSYSSVSDLPSNMCGLSIITPPKITERIVEEAITFGIKHIWMQPGAESRLAIEICLKNNVNVIADGSCLLVVLGYHEN